MVKSIIKEIIIILLLVITILLILGILFYDYRPSTKKIPSQVAEYTLPQDMQKELEETLQSSEGQNIIKVYRVTSDDLKIHERNNDYIKGRTNPFDKIDATSTALSVPKYFSVIGVRIVSISLMDRIVLK